MNFFLFLGLAFILTFVIGKLIEKIRVPWIFGALVLGAGLAAYNPFPQVTSSAEFTFLGQLGMYFLLFIVGFEINLHKLRKIGNFIIKGTIFIISLEALFGGLLIHFVFGYGWLVSFVVSLSFTTVGEAILIPILDEFKIINTRLGQSIIGIGTLDDVVEIAMLIFVAFFVGYGQVSHTGIALIILSLGFLFLFTLALTKLKGESQKFTFLPIEVLFLISLFIFFLFIGVGQYGHASAIAALLAGIGLRMFLPPKKLQAIESEVRTMCYGFFAPIFFLWVGLSMDIGYIIKYPLLILLVVAVTNLAKLLGSYLIGRKKLGTRQSILLGIGLSVRFSVSIIIIKILYESNIIGVDLYSVIVASSVVFNFIVPLLFSNLLARWKLPLESVKS
jgi:Kef-type K+ transport system membrane component KefB